MLYILCAIIPAIISSYLVYQHYRNKNILIVQRNELMEQENEKIKQANEQCKLENNQLSFQNSMIKQRQESLIQQNEEIEGLNEQYNILKNSISLAERDISHLKTQQDTLNSILTEINGQIELSQQTAATAAEDFYNSELAAAKERLKLTLLLEQEKYQKAIQESEENFNIQRQLIAETIAQLQGELSSIQSKHNAAIEEARRKEEMETQLDFYRVQIPEEDRNEINALLSIKHLLSNKRNLYMLIWTSYYSKRVNELAVRVLGSKTVSGIYRITNIETQQMYIGQARDVRERWREHLKSALGIDTPSSTKLYPNMMKYGVENFTFELLEMCADTTQLNEKERYWIDFYDTYNNGLNSNRGINK